MFQIKYLKDLYQLPVSTTKSDDILDQLNSILSDENQDFILSFNNIFLSRKVNYNLLEIGYSPQEIIEVTKASNIETFFNIINFDFTFSITNDQYATVFDAKKIFADNFYTVPKNIIIQYKNKELRDSDKIIQFYTDKNTTFQVSVNENYFLVKTYFNNFHFACLNLDSTVENLKETISMYSQTDNSIDFKCAYSDNLKEICEQYNIKDESGIDNKNLQELAFIVPVFEFTKSTKNDFKKLTVTIHIIDKKHKREIIKKYNSTEKLSLYSLTILIERDLKIDRSQFVPFNQEGRKMKLTDFASPNNNNFVFKIINSIKVLIDKTLQEISILTTIKEIQEKYKFEEHNFGIIINNHYVYEKDEDNTYLIVHFMNISKEPTVINIQYSSEPSYLITYTKVDINKRTKTQFIIPNRMSTDQKAIIYLHQNKYSVKIINNNQNEIEYQDSKKIIIKYMLKYKNSLIYKSIGIVGENLRIIDFLYQVYKNDNTSYDVFIEKSKKEKLNFWDPISNIYYDIKNRITVDSSIDWRKTLILDLYNNKNTFDEISHIGRIKSVKIINNYCHEKGFSAENLYLYADFNKLRKDDIPSLVRFENNFFILNQERDKKTLKIQNFSNLNLKLTLSEKDYSKCAEIIRSMFQLHEEKSQFSCNINGKNYILPQKFDAGAFPNNCEIGIKYEYQKKNQIKFRYQDSEDKLLKIDIDKPIESIIPIILKEFNLWYLSKSVIYFSFYTFEFPHDKSISYFHIPETATIEIREKKDAFPIQISTPENPNFDIYYFVKDDTIKDVIDHLQTRFKRKFAIFKDSKAKKRMIKDTKLDENMKLYAVSKQKTIKCEGSIGDNIIGVSEILKVKDASEYISTKLEKRVYIFTKNEENDSYEAAEEGKRLYEYEEQLYAHQYFPTIDFNYVIFTNNEHISELNTINWLREKFISKVLLINMNDFIINKNETRLNETDTIGQILTNFQGKLNIYIKDNNQESKTFASRVSAKKPTTINDNLYKSTRSRRSYRPVTSSVNTSDDDFRNATKSSYLKRMKSILKSDSDKEEPTKKIKIPTVKKKKQESDDNDEKNYSDEEEPEDFTKATKKIKIPIIKKKTNDKKKKQKNDDDEEKSDSDKESMPSSEEEEKITYKIQFNRDEIDNGADFSLTQKSTAGFISLAMFDDLENKKKIGRGATSEVYKVKIRKYPSKDFVLKIIDIDIIKKENCEEEEEEDLCPFDIDKLKRFMSEFEVLNQINHPNIIKTYGFYPGDRKNPPAILLEFCPFDLKKIIKKIDYQQQIEIIIEISEGMKKIHEAGIIHRDLKPENILIDSEYHVKISDFGISTLINLDSETMSRTQFAGTITFMAPEIINESKYYNEKVDVYSFGVVVYWILTKGEYPSIKLVDVAKGEQAQIPKEISDSWRDLIQKCWSFDPNDRPSFTEISEILRKMKIKEE